VVPSGGIEVSGGTFEDWMKRRGFNANQAAEYLDIERRTIDRYLSGELMIPQRVWFACLTLEPMQLWRLVPRGDLEHNDWRASSYSGEAIVRAQNRPLARWHATGVFGVAARRRPTDKASPENPWLTNRVKAEEMVPTKDWPLAGDPGVLSVAIVNRAFLTPYTVGLDDPDTRRIVEHKFADLWTRHNISATLELGARRGVIRLRRDVGRDTREKIRNSVQDLLKKEEDA
jgi:hypothetical protein